MSIPLIFQTHLNVGLKKLKDVCFSQRYMHALPKEIKTGFKIYKLAAFLIAFPAIASGTYWVAIHHHSRHSRLTWKPYEHLHRRTKPFPWGDGNKSLFHNKFTNALPDGHEPMPDDFVDPNPELAPKQPKDATPPKGADPPKGSTPPTDAIPPKEATPPKDTIPPKEATPPTSTTPPKDAIPPNGTPPNDSIPSKDAIPPTDATPLKDSIPPADTTPPADKITPSPQGTRGLVKPPSPKQVEFSAASCPASVLPPISLPPGVAKSETASIPSKSATSSCPAAGVAQPDTTRLRSSSKNVKPPTLTEPPTS